MSFPRPGPLAHSHNSASSQTTVHRSVEQDGALDRSEAHRQMVSAPASSECSGRSSRRPTGGTKAPGDDRGRTGAHVPPAGRCRWLYCRPCGLYYAAHVSLDCRWSLAAAPRAKAGASRRAAVARDSGHVRPSCSCGRSGWLSPGRGRPVGHGAASTEQAGPNRVGISNPCLGNQ